MKVRIITLILVAVLGMASIASAVQVQLPCSANARQGGGWATDFMFMQALEPGATMPFFKFDVSAIPENATVNSAAIHTFLYYSDGDYDPAWQYAAREVLYDWGENNATYPAIGAADLGPAAAVTGTDQWIVNDITPALVQGWVDGTKPNYGVSVSKVVSGPPVCVKNRLDPTYAPYLLVDYTPPTGVQNPQNLLRNSGFEADGNIGKDVVGYDVSGTGWAVAPYSNVSEGTSTDNPHSGDYSWVCSMSGPSATVPMVSQTFATSASSFKVEGWIKTTTGANYGIGVVRIRENKTGIAGTVKCFSDGAWSTNIYDIALSAPAWDSWSAYGMSNNGGPLNDAVVVADIGAWTHFSVTVPALPGVTSYSVDISQIRWTASEPEPAGNLNKAYFDDITVTPIYANPLREQLTNGGFEADGVLGWWGTPSGWRLNDFGHVPTGTVETNPHGGNHAYSLCRFYTGSTFPVLSQTFKAGGDFRVEGYVRTVEGGGSVRIRENKIGPAGSVRYWDYASNAWVNSTVDFAEATGYYQLDTFGIGANGSAGVGVGSNNQWTKFDFSILALPGVTDYAIDLGSPYFASGGTNETYYTYWDDISVTAENISLAGTGNLRAPFEIQPGTAMVDGDLSDWTNAHWTRMGLVYDANPTDIAEAYYAAKWASDKVYVAVKVRDTARYFTNTYTDWDARDGIEIYLHTNGAGPQNYPNEEAAQYYAVGITALDHASVWSCFARSPLVSIAAGTGFQAAGREVSGWLHYEAAMTPFQYYGGLVSQPNVPNTLKPGDIIGLDVVAVSNAAGVYKGMMAENQAVAKWAYWDRFGLHQLDDGSIPYNSIAQAKTMQDNSVVNISDAVVTGAFYGDTDIDWPGVGFAIESPNRESGSRLIWNWYDTDAARVVQAGDVVNILGTARTIAGERVIIPSSVAVSRHGAAIRAPVAMNNAASAGGALGGQPTLTNNAATDAQSAGLNNIGLLTKIFGKVTHCSSNNPIYFESEYFYVDDGSGLNDGSGFTGIMCRPSGTTWGPDYMPAEGSYVSVTGVMGVADVGGKPVRYFWTVSWDPQD